jgi:hypothetical protein
MGPSAIVERLHQLGLRRETIADRFRYLRPSEPLDVHSTAYVLELVTEIRARLAVFDSFNATLALQGLDPSSTTDVERFWRRTDPLAQAQVAVAVLDHVVKNPEARGKYSYGSERKHSGAEVHLGMATMEHIVRGKTGRSRLTVNKDRAGYHRDNPPGIFRLASDPETGLVKALLVPDESRDADGGFRPTTLMEKISRYLELFPSESKSRHSIETTVDGKAEYIRKAIDVLVAEGYAGEEDGARGARLVHLIRAYREGGNE